MRTMRKSQWMSLAACVAVVGLMNGFARGEPQDLNNADVTVGENGSLELRPDDFGFWADIPGFCAGAEVHDFFNPGPDDKGNDPTREFPSFMAVTLMHVNPDTLDGKVALTDHTCSNVYNINPPSGRGGPADFDITLVQPNTTDSLPESTNSVFTVTGGDINLNLSINLTQTVGTAPPGPNGEPSAFVDLAYAITNNGSAPVELILVRHIDEDMPWVDTNVGPFYVDDSVGMDFAELGRPQIYAQDGNVTTAALVLRTVEDPFDDPRTVDSTYYMTKGQPNPNPLEQPPGHPTLEDGPGCYDGATCPANSLCPMYVAGTDHQYWERPGAPNCWRDYVPGVGYFTPGSSDPAVVGDSSIGLQVQFNVPVGETYNITFETLYGFRPVPTRFLPPNVKTALVDNHVDENGLGEFLFTIRNDNPGGGGAPDDIDEIYVDVEAGLIGGGDRSAEFTLLRDGWSAQNCTGFDANGHALFRLTNDSGESIVFAGAPFRGRFRILANDLTEDTNPDTGAIVEPLSVRLSFAQHQPNLSPDDYDWTASCAAGDYSFGPRQENGLWSEQATNSAYLRVPSFSAWGKAALLIIVALIGAGLVIRSRRPASSL